MYEYDVTPRVGVETEKSKANVEGRAAGYGECADRKKSKVNGYKKSVSRVVVWYISYRCQRMVSADAVRCPRLRMKGDEEEGAVNAMRRIIGQK